MITTQGAKVTGNVEEVNGGENMWGDKSGQKTMTATYYESSDKKDKIVVDTHVNTLQLEPLRTI